jgi:hypothetical protein
MYLIEYAGRGTQSNNVDSQSKEGGKDGAKRRGLFSRGLLVTYVGEELRTVKDQKEGSRVWNTFL